MLCSPCLPRMRSRRESWPCLKVLSRNCCCLRIMSCSSFSACSMSPSPDLPGAVLVAGARQPLHALDHVVEFLLAQRPGVGIERPRQGLRIVAHLLGEL